MDIPILRIDVQKYDPIELGFEADAGPHTAPSKTLGYSCKPGNLFTRYYKISAITVANPHHEINSV